MSYERKIIHGIPFFARGADLYAWLGTDGCSDAGNNVHESTSITDGRPMLKLGTYDAGTDTLELAADWRQSAEPKLVEWRRTQIARSRALLRRTAAPAAAAAASK